MYDSKSKQKCEMDQDEKPNQQSSSKSKFNEEEYKRWSETVTNKKGSNQK